MRKLFAYAPHYLREIYASNHQCGIFWSAATFTKLCTTKVATSSGFQIRKSGETTICVQLSSFQISKWKRLGQRIRKAEERERGGIIQFQCREMKPPAPQLTISAVSQFCTFLKPLAPSFRKQQATQWNLFRETRVGGLQHVLFRWICPRKPVG